MAGDSIPDDVREFVLKYVDSIVELEALLLLRRENMVSWNTATLAERLYISQDVASGVLGRLHGDGFLAADRGNYRYDCATPQLAALTDRTAHVYARQLIPMTHLIHSRTSRIREFANAFKLRKET